MNARATAAWSACLRCFNGAAEPGICRAPQLRHRFGVRTIDVDTARTRAGACGPDGEWFLYRKPHKEAA